MKLLHFADSPIQQSQFPGPPELPTPGAVSDSPTGVFTGGDRLKGMKLASTGASNARNDAAQALPQRLLDPVGVWNGVDWDNGLGHGHPADLGVVITQAGEDRGHYLPGLVWSPWTLHSKEGRVVFTSEKVASVQTRTHWKQAGMRVRNILGWHCALPVLCGQGCYVTG